MKTSRHSIYRKIFFACFTLLAGLILLPAGQSSFAVAFAQGVTVVNGASFATDNTLTPEGIASAFGSFVTQNPAGENAASQPLPTTLSGLSLTVNGTPAQLFYAGPGQVNFLVPSGTAIGTANVIVTSSNGTTKSGTMKIVATTPGVFAANQSGSGFAAAQTTKDGITNTPVVNDNGTPRDIDAGSTASPTYLVLYATGVRKVPAANPNDDNGVAEAVTVTIQGVPTTVTYAGPQGQFVGLDQINAIIPPELAGLGVVDVQLSVKTGTNPPILANTVSIKLGGQIPNIRPQAIASGDTVNGTLTINDQVEQDTSTGHTFFFDAFRFSGTANTSVMVDLRSAEFDAAIILRKVNPDGTLSFVAADDQTGGLGIAGGQRADVNNNSLLLTVLPDTADYVIFVTTSDFQPNGTGNYTLKFQTGNITPLAYGATINGQISVNDLQVQSGIYLDAYSFTGAKGDKVQIRMSAPSPILPYLILKSKSGDELYIGDQNGGGTDALISPAGGLPQAGTYIIIATPLEPNRLGSYTLTLTRNSSFGETNAASGRAATGETRGGSPRRGTMAERFGTRRPVGEPQ